MRRAAGAIVLALVVAACGSNPYPLPPPGSDGRQSSVVAVGQETNAVLAFIELHPGDRIELVSASPIGVLDGASVEMFVSRYVPQTDGTFLIGSTFDELEGAVIEAPGGSPGPDNVIGIAAKLTGDRPGRYEVTDLRIRYRLNGGPKREGKGIDVQWIICVDDPAPARCE